MVEQSIVGTKCSRTWWGVASCMIIFRRCDKLHEVKEILYFQQPVACAIYSAVFAIEMHAWRKGAHTYQKAPKVWHHIHMHILLTYWERAISTLLSSWQTEIENLNISICDMSDSHCYCHNGLCGCSDGYQLDQENHLCKGNSEFAINIIIITE